MHFVAENSLLPKNISAHLGEIHEMFKVFRSLCLFSSSPIFVQSDNVTYCVIMVNMI